MATSSPGRAFEFLSPLNVVNPAQRSGAASDRWTLDRAFKGFYSAFFAGFWSGARDESWRWERIWSKDGKFGVDCR
jgi:hypothetical protein